MNDENAVTKPNQTGLTKWDMPMDLNHLTMTQIKFIGQSMAESGMFPDLAKDAAKAMVKILAGQEIGVGPFQAMTGINIIQGKAAMGANLIAGKVKSSGKYNYKADVTSESCTVTIREKGVDGRFEDAGSFTFTMKDAERIGLAHKDNWKNYPANMLFARALTTAQRMYAPDATNGVLVYDPDELGAITNDQGTVVENQARDNALSDALDKIEAAKDEDELTDVVANLPADIQKSVTKAASDKFHQLSMVEETE